MLIEKNYFIIFLDNFMRFAYSIVYQPCFDHLCMVYLDKIFKCDKSEGRN